MRQQHVEPYFTHTDDTAEVFVSSLSWKAIQAIISISTMEAFPLSITITLHHDSLCPCANVGGVLLNPLNPIQSLDDLEGAVKGCLCEKLDLTMRSDLSQAAKDRAMKRINESDPT